MYRGCAVKLPRRHILQLAAGAAVLVLGSHAAGAQGYPSQPVTFVVSFAAGGVADVVARLVAQKLGDHGVGKFVVENRGGAGGNLAARVVSTAAADGYTVLATTTALAINATASRNKGYATEDLRAVAIVALASDVMAVHPGNSAKSIKELIANAGDKGIAYGTPGLGTGPYIAAAYFYQEVAKTKAVHVPFSGGAPAVAAADRQPCRRHQCVVADGAAADRAGRAARPWHPQPAAQFGAAQCPHLWRSGLPELLLRDLGRIFRSRQHSRCDRGKTQCGD